MQEHPSFVKTIKATEQLAEKYLTLVHSSDNKNKDTIDIHLALEYTESDTLLNINSKRSNRFYFDSDPNGSVID